MKVTVHSLLRTTLYSSTAGVLLGIPLVSFIPARLRGQEQVAAPTVIRGQSPPGNSPWSRLFGNRTSASSSPNVAADLADPTGMESAAATPQQSQPTRSQLRAQAKFMRRNPVAARMMMLKQQEQLLAEQQNSLEQGYEAEAVPEPEVFDSLQIDADEWSDAPGRAITEQVPLGTNDKPWWQTGEKPVNSRERRIIDDEPIAAAETVPDAAAPVAAAPAPAPVVADPFPSEPNLAPAIGTIAPQRTAAATPATPATPVAAAPPAGKVEEWSLTFPEDAPAGRARVSANPTPPAVTTTPLSPSAPSAAVTAQPAVTDLPPEPAPVADVTHPAVPVESTPVESTPVESTPVESTPAEEPAYLPPEPEAPWAGTTSPVKAAPAVVQPIAPQAPTSDLPLPAAPATLVPPAASEQVVTAEPQAFPVFATPEQEPFVPSEPPADVTTPTPAVVAEQPAEVLEHPGAPTPASPFTGLKLDAQPATPSHSLSAPAGEPAVLPTIEPQPASDEFLPPKPLEASADPVPSGPAAPEFIAESVVPHSTEVIELPPEPAPADAPLQSPTAVPGLVPYLVDDPTIPSAPVTTAVPQFTPQDLRGDRTGDNTLEPSNPAPFIPPAPEDFSGHLETPAQDYYVPGVMAEPGPGLPAAPEAPPAAAPGANVAPDVTAWAPEPLSTGPDSLQVPDPIVAPSTAKRLAAPAATTPQQTNSKIERIASRKGLNGFKGFCPVAIKDHRELLDARPEYSAVHNGRRYFFSSAASQTLFEADPENYAPAALGNDVVHLMLTGESRAGSLEHAVWFRSRLYMFSTAETMETFVASPSIHAWEE